MTHNKWYDNEIKTIYENYKTMSDSELHSIIPHHSESSIATKRKEIGLTRPVWNKKYSFDDVIMEMDKRKYKIISDKSDFNNAGSSIKYICPIHNDCVQETNLGHLLEGKGCIYCGYIKTGKSEALSREVCIDMCNLRGFEFVDNKIISNKTHILFICSRHRTAGVQKMTYHNMKRDGYGCKYCRSSLLSCSNGEKRIKNFLNELGIKFIQQYRFDDCVDQCSLPFDFYIPDNKIIIEYDGEHHYKPISFNGVSSERAEYLHNKTVEHDNLKNIYCKTHKIKIIRIPFWSLDDIEVVLFDKLVKFKVIERIA